MYFVCFPQNFQKPDSKFFLCQKRKSELLIDGLIISVQLLTFSVRKRQKFFVKWVKKCTLSALLNFASKYRNFDHNCVKVWSIKLVQNKDVLFLWDSITAWTWFESIMRWSHWNCGISGRLIKFHRSRSKFFFYLTQSVQTSSKTFSSAWREISKIFLEILLIERIPFLVRSNFFIF